ncbi:ABC transporter permease [Rugosimonospora acidiphila]|uniref:ABC transporter permease n=1 Tax=Rugosimonospora acidiphila TaxID=556531 RepID=A0ABP9S212_9ACTN
MNHDSGAGAGMGAAPARSRPGGSTTPRRWARDLALGARLAFAGGRESWLRTALTSIGIALGVVLLLGCAAIPAISRAHAQREAARGLFANWSAQLTPGDDTELVADVDTTYRGVPITGRIVQAEGPKAPVPPGLSGLPAPGRLVVSPALARLLRSPDGALLRPRLDYPVVGTIGPAGLVGPGEYAFYLGDDKLSGELADNFDIQRLDRFGDARQLRPLDTTLILLVLIIFVVLLLPVVVFIATAVRFGGEQRDRRLAALRLVGADSGMARRIAAGEALVSSAFGLVLGIAGFLVVRQLAQSVTLWDQSVYASDIRPSLPLGLLVVLAVPAMAVSASLLALRRVVIEPLGVVRRAPGTRRRLWWRLVLPVLGLVLLNPLSHRIDLRGGTLPQVRVIAGTVLLLLAVAALLPWLIDAVVARLGGGGVPWQLAVRRLQLSSGASARAVSGVAVAAAGAIALQMLFGAAARTYTAPTGQDANGSRVQVSLLGAGTAEYQTLLHRLLSTSGVRGGYGFSSGTLAALGRPTKHVNGDQPGLYGLTVSDCASLRQVLALSACADGDVFLVGPASPAVPSPGQRVTVGVADPSDPKPPVWTVPTTIPQVSLRPGSDGALSGLVATPGAIGPAALPHNFYVELSADLTSPDTIERIGDAAAGVDPTATVKTWEPARVDHRFATIRQGLFIGALVILLLVGASLLIGTLEQLRDRRRLLPVLVAFGTRRTTLSRSVLWQTALPVLLGMVLAVLVGVGLGAVLLRLVHARVVMNWSSVGGIAGAAALMVLLVTGLSMPALWRLMRPEGLRTE